MWNVVILIFVRDSRRVAASAKPIRQAWSGRPLANQSTRANDGHLAVNPP